MDVLNEAASALELIRKEDSVVEEQASLFQQQVSAVTVTSDAEYQEVAEFGKTLKAKSNEVSAFFKPLKEQAHKSHKMICEKEKQMLAPIVGAEKHLKAQLSKYAQECEKARKQAEEKAIKAIQEDVENKLKEAVALECEGKALESQMAVMEAEMASNVASTISVQNEAPKVSGVSSRKSWKITKVDISNVPDEVMGVPLKMLDEKAVMQIIKGMKGAIKIPGIEYEEVSQNSFRGGNAV